MAARRPLPVHKHERINAPDQQDVLLNYWPVVHAERKIQMWRRLATSRGVWEGVDPLVSGRCCDVVVFRRLE